MKKNILMIILHDLGRHLHCYGWDSVNSPNIDKLASEGILFENAFCTAPLCSPSRSSIMTGRYPHSNGIMGLVHRSWRFNAGEKFLPQFLKDAGYETLLFGLQHEMPYSETSKLGYETVFQDSTHAPDVASQFAGWIKQRVPSDRPFYASVGFKQVHRPHKNGVFASGAPEKVKVPGYLPDLPSVREDIAAYEALVELADDAVGKMLNSLDEAGAADETIVIFTTDHGTDWPRAKSSLYDPGIGTALIMKVPGEKCLKKHEDCLISNIDILPTLLDMCNIPIPEGVQGYSFWPLITGLDYLRRREVFCERTWHATYDPIRCIRTEKFKLIHNFRPGRPLLVAPEFIQKVGADEIEKYFGFPRPEYELYDLISDPGETRNLSGLQEYELIEKDLQQRLDAFLQESGDPVLKGEIPHPGRHDDVWDWCETGGKWCLYDPKDNQVHKI